MQGKAAFGTVKRGYTNGMRVSGSENNAAMQKMDKPRKEECEMAAKSKMSYGYEHADGTKETRSVSNINPEATGEALLSLANEFMSLQDENVKTLVSVKRIDTTELM